jgi:DNA polymerase III delta prime subunit
MKAKWVDESKAIIEAVSARIGESNESNKYRINARISLTPRDKMDKYEMTNLVNHMRSIVKAFDANESYLS